MTFDYAALVGCIVLLTIQVRVLYDNSLCLVYPLICLLEDEMQTLVQTTVDTI
jgi:hypothetical protein